MKNRKSIVLLITLLLLLGMYTCSGDSSAKDQTAAEDIVSVQTTPVQQKNMRQVLNLLGNVKAEQEVRIFSKIPDRITAISADMGDKVQSGDLLAEIENTKIRSQVNQMKANLQQAQSQLDNLEREFKRSKNLLEQNAMSQQQFDQTKTQMEAARSQVKSLQEGLKQAKSQLEDCFIRSPISGIVGQRFLDAGDMASMQQPLFTVVQMDTVKVIVNIPEKYAGMMKKGLTALVDVAAFKDTSFTGYVSKISPVVDPVTRMLTVEILVPNAKMKLRAGMFAEVRVILAVHKNAMAIPQYAILQKTEVKVLQSGEQKISRDEHVYVVRKDRAYYQSIQTGFQDGNLTEVVSGLNPTDQVVLLGQNNLQDSTKVHVIQKEDRS